MFQLLKRLRDGGEGTEDEATYTKRRKQLFAHLPDRPARDIGYDTQPEEYAHARTQPVRYSRVGRREVAGSKTSTFLRNLLTKVRDKDEQLRRLQNYIAEQQAKLDAQLHHVTSRFTLSRTYMYDLQQRQADEILRKYELTGASYLFAARLAETTPTQHASMTCVLFITMHATMPVVELPSGRGFEIETFVVPPNVSITRFATAAHGRTLLDHKYWTPSEVLNAVQQRLVDVRTSPLDFNYDKMLELVDRAYASKLLHHQKHLFDTLVSQLGYVQQFPERQDAFDELVHQVNAQCLMGRREPQLLLPGELCPDKTYSLSEDDFGIALGAVLCCPLTPAERHVKPACTELIGLGMIKQAVEDMKASATPLDTSMTTALPYCNVSYDTKTGRVQVEVSLHQLINRLAYDDNFRNFIVLDFSCNVPSVQTMPLQPHPASILGEAVTASGLAGGVSPSSRTA